MSGTPSSVYRKTYGSRLSADATEIGPSRVTPGKILAYDAFAGTLIASSGSNVLAVDPNAKQTPIACILDAADLKPVTSLAPGELVSLFGEFSAGSPGSPPAGLFPTSFAGTTIDVNGLPSPLLYVGGEQINFQVPAGIAGGEQANVQFTSALSNLSDSRTLPIVASNPTVFLNTAPPSPALVTCSPYSSASLAGLLPLALNPDGSVNTCLNPAVKGSAVTLFLNGPGVTSFPVITGAPLTVASLSALPGAIPNVLQVSLQIPADQAAGVVQILLTVGGIPTRDATVIVWVK